MTDKNASNIDKSLSKLKPYQLSALIERSVELELVNKNCSQEELTKGIVNSKGKIQSEMLFRLGDNLIDNNEIELALIMLNSSLGGASGSKHKNRLQNSLGLAFYMNGKLKEAIEVFSKLLKRKIDNGLKSSTLHYLGLSHFDAGAFTAAVDNMESAVKLYESDKNIEAAIPPMEDIARVYQEQNEHIKALKILEKAYDHSKEIMLESALVRISASRGESLLAMGKYRSASEALEFSLKDRTSPHETIDRMRLLAHSYTLMAAMYPPGPPPNTTKSKLCAAIFYRFLWIKYYFPKLLAQLHALMCFCRVLKIEHFVDYRLQSARAYISDYVV